MSAKSWKNPEAKVIVTFTKVQLSLQQQPYSALFVPQPW